MTRCGEEASRQAHNLKTTGSIPVAATMPTPEELADTIAENATKPAQASQDGRSAAQHSLKDQIAAAQYLADREAAQRTSQPFRTFNTRPPGAT